MDDALKTREYVEFEGEITRPDLVTAVRYSAMRRDLQSMRRSHLFVMIAGVIILFLVAMLSMQGRNVEELPILAGGLAVVLVYATSMHRWLAGRYVKNNSDIMGPVKGRIDRNSLWIENERQTRYRPFRHLVGTDMNRRGWVLCFDPTLSMFEMLPMSGFDDPDTASILASNLSQARPFSAVAAFDSRAEWMRGPRLARGEPTLLFLTKATTSLRSPKDNRVKPVLTVQLGPQKDPWGL